MAQPMLETIAPTRRLIADKAYDADRLRLWLGERGIEAVIPGRASRDVAYPLNRVAYRRRNIVERMFGRLKNWRRIATRYDRLAVNYLAAIALVATVTQWLDLIPYLESPGGFTHAASARLDQVGRERTSYPSAVSFYLSLSRKA